MTLSSYKSVFYDEDATTVMVFYGIAGCGKTSLSRALAYQISAQYLAPSQFGLAHSPDGKRIQEARLKRYSQFFQILEKGIRNYNTIVADGCFDDQIIQDRLRRIILTHKVKWVAVFCFTSDFNETIRRIVNRKGDYLSPDPMACTRHSFEETKNCSPDLIRSAVKVARGSHFNYDSATGSLELDFGSPIELLELRETVSRINGAHQ